MTDIIQTRVNKTIYSANSCDFKIALAPFLGITTFDWEQKRERKLVHAMRRNGTPLGKTAGKYSVANVGFTMLAATYDRLTDLLTPLGLGSYGDAEFPILITINEPGQPVPPIVIAIADCSIVNEKETVAEGIDELLVEVDILASTLTRNGKQLWSFVKGLGQ
jgi:hypothetical protein